MITDLALLLYREQYGSLVESSREQLAQLGGEVGIGGDDQMVQRGEGRDGCAVQLRFMSCQIQGLEWSKWCKAFLI